MTTTLRTCLPLVLILAAGCGAGAEAPQGNAATARATQTQTPAPLPSDFFGVVAPELLPAETGALDQAIDAQAKAGVNLIRQPFLWQEIEPTRGVYDWAAYDRLVGRAAKSGIAIMPIIFGVPRREASRRAKGVKVTATTTMPPKSPARFAAFAAAVAKRYGTGGTFWAQNSTLPARPITDWQVWNEPNLPPYWGGKPNAAQYAKLLIATSTALRAADPKAVIVTGGVPESRLGVPLQTYVARDGEGRGRQGLRRAGGASVRADRRRRAAQDPPGACGGDPRRREEPGRVDHRVSAGRRAGRAAGSPSPSAGRRS